MTKILSIETSCDETSAAVNYKQYLKNNVTTTQDVHEEYGGVVPELASRAHQKNIVPIIDQALKGGNIRKEELNAVAYTQGPGLIGALLVGNSFAKGMSLSLDIPLIEVNHLHAHHLSHFIEEPGPDFPFLNLLVSGGHTQLVLVKNYLDYEVLGQTIDDAAGEALDKAGKILGLPYPGGPAVDDQAKKGNANAFDFPLPGISGLDFSFSGLKTSLLYFVRDQLKKDENFIENNLPDICASYQECIVDFLIKKLEKAGNEQQIKAIGIAGGVAANSFLREAAKKLADKKGWELFIPALEYCTDNAAMINQVAYHKYKKGIFAGLESVPFAR